MLSVRRALLSARIIPVMLKGSITAFWTVSNITIRTLPSLPARAQHLQPNQIIEATVSNRTSTTPSRQAQPQGGRWRQPFTISFRAALPPYNKLRTSAVGKAGCQMSAKPPKGTRLPSF